MSWSLVILTAVLVSCLLAAPAAAAIKSYTDSQGVIRITNVPAQAGEIPAETPVTPPPALEVPEKTPAGQEARRLPEAGPLPAPAAEPGPEQQVKLPEVPEITPPAIWPEPRLAAEDLPAFKTREPADALSGGSTPRPGPVRPVAFDPEADGAVSIAPRAAAEPKPEPASSGGIRRFRNRQGVLVITNLAPVPQQAPLPLVQAKNPGAPGLKSPAEQPVLSGTLPPAPILRPVSWSPDQSMPAPSPAAAAADKMAWGPGTIRRYRDKQGVLHIENVGPGPGKKLKPPPVLARAEPVMATEPPLPERSPTGEEDRPKSGVKPAAFSGEKEGKPAALLTAAATRMEEIAGPEGIRRYRDRLGIWHIKTVDDSWLVKPPPLPPLPRPAATTREVLLAAAQAATRLPEAAGVAKAPVLARIPAAPGGIRAVKDSRGRLTITNVPPRPGQGTPAWLLASAQLDPIIQEAARAYRLPPALIRALIKVESNFVNAAVSPKGAMGLMQLMPGTARFLGVQDPFNPSENIHGGCRYLRLLIDSFGGSLPLALAGYNAGPQRVVDCGYRVPEIKETQNFLTQVLGWYFTVEKQARRPWT